MYFDNIIGHDRTKQFILNSMKKDRISHAYLFEGPSGIGKMMFSMELSKIILKTNNLENSPDFKILRPDKASFKIGQIRDMQLDIVIKPYKNKKIYILEDAHKMTVQAQNALLKTLEEPPNYALIILIVENSSSILDTIKSRCEVVKFSPLTQIQIQKYLIDNKNIDSQRAKVMASFSMGILSKALDLCYSEEFNDKRNEIQEYLNIIQSRDLVDMYTINTKLEKYKSNLNEIMDILVTYFRDILMIKQGVDESLIINLDQIEFLNNLSKKFTYFQISNIIDIIDESNKNLMNNCNFNMVIGTMILNIYEVIK
ncbi:MAG: DNA polymerase III subunit delta' [Tepidibacter sp.]|jgi:DNA polymerase-3 subunit delta'|uniref:DNA polymerase III subunit n=1 Tax=Tepidibacter sp. TaxID=2529387 RepID=UPI0025FDFAC5|nr:DNA polymerase III subunit delta' C-terminal domain-containing protein [Tepidibacter sp.]MCT4508621.1 DNA polymerase III subunit delta' [Tepidibacter sp.]